MHAYKRMKKRIVIIGGAFLLLAAPLVASGDVHLGGSLARKPPTPAPVPSTESWNPLKPLQKEGEPESERALAGYFDKDGFSGLGTPKGDAAWTVAVNDLGAASFTQRQN